MSEYNQDNKNYEERYMRREERRRQERLKRQKRNRIIIVGGAAAIIIVIVLILVFSVSHCSSCSRNGSAVQTNATEAATIATEPAEQLTILLGQQGV